MISYQNTDKETEIIQIGEGQISRQWKSKKQSPTKKHPKCFKQLPKFNPEKIDEKRLQKLVAKK